MSNTIRKFAVLSAAFAVVSLVQLCDGAQAKAANGVSFKTSVKKLTTKCRIKVTVSAKLGPFSANASFGPVYINKPTGGGKKCRNYSKTVAGISIKVRICVYKNKVRVTVTASKKVFGKTLRLSDTKTISFS